MMGEDARDVGRFVDPMSASINEQLRMVSTDTGTYTPAGEIKTQANEAQSALDAETSATEAASAIEEEARKKRNAMFQTEGGASGDPVMSVGSRDTYYGN